MVVDGSENANKTDEEVIIKIPYEFRPLPEIGQIVQALDRAGEPIGSARIISVQLTASMNKMPIISFAVDKSLLKIARNIRFQSENLQASVVCRCNDLDLEEIRALIAQGYTSVNEIKREARLGMGPCQGRNCLPIVLSELSRALKKPIAQLVPGTYRPVVKSVALEELVAYQDEEE
ncbi:MAG: (2Fe-2S)-binding protein [Defluviitaleaceae bacterium]|nr:(2Fe-2S)-binding protein [Defluviitaleaceae bacterium]